MFYLSVHVNCLAKKKKEKENGQEKKNLKGIVYLFDSLRILFSYNLSAIKCGFLFSFQAYQFSVFVTFVKASYMFNKASYLVNCIHRGDTSNLSHAARLV